MVALLVATAHWATLSMAQPMTALPGRAVLFPLFIRRFTTVPFMGDLLETPLPKGLVLPVLETAQVNLWFPLLVTCIPEFIRMPRAPTLDLLSMWMPPSRVLRVVTWSLSRVRLPPVLLHLSPLDRLLKDRVIPTPLDILPWFMAPRRLSLLRSPRRLVSATMILPTSRYIPWPPLRR